MTQDFPPRRADITITLEVGQGLIQQPLFRVGWASAMQQVGLLEFAEAVKYLRPFFRF